MLGEIEWLYSRIVGRCLAMAMSETGLGRVKTPSPGKSVRSHDRSVSGHDRSHQRLGPDDVYDPC